jgi:hypothetical protein
MVETEGYSTMYTDLDAGGSDQYSPMGDATVQACEDRCNAFTKLGSRYSCPAFVMDFRKENGKPRNNCWIKHSGINGATMSVASGVNTYNISAKLNCPAPSTSTIPPKSNPTKEEIVLSDWDVEQIKKVHSSVRSTDNTQFTITDSEMQSYIQAQVRLNTPYSAVNSTGSTPTTVGTNGCPSATNTQKWMFNDYRTIIQGYVNNKTSNYADFQTQNKINGFSTIGFEPFVEGATALKTTNITDKIIEAANKVGFTITVEFIREYNQHILTYTTEANQSKQAFFKKLVNLGIKSSDDYVNVLKEMETGVGFVISKWAPWLVDTLPTHKVTDATTMAKFRDNMKKQIYTNFGFGKPYYPTVDKQGHQVYFWYLNELSKLGVGVYEMEGFSTIHKTVLGMQMNMSSQMDLKSNSWEMVKLFPNDPFLKLVPVYQDMKFNYKSSGTEQGNKDNFNAFCATVKQLIPPNLIDKLKLFSDRIKQYGMSSFMEYITFMNVLSSTVGTVGDLVELMNTVQKYINTTSGLKQQLPNTFKTGKVTLSTGQTVDIFDYNIVKWFINSGLMKNNNKYGVSNNNGISFTGYVNTLNTQNWTYGNTMVTTMDANANYVESEQRGNTIANKTYSSVTYNLATDPFKMTVEKFGGMDTEEYEPGWIGRIGDWVSNLFSNDKEGLTDNTLSDHETLKQFGVSDANTQLPPILKTFRDHYEVTDFNEMIFYISCLRRVGISSVDLIPTSGGSSCLKLLKRYRIDKLQVDVFTQHMKNAGFIQWGGPYGLKQFIINTLEFGVNQDTLNYKQFIYMLRKFGCDFSIQDNVRLLYAFMWVIKILTNIKYNDSGKLANVTFQPSKQVTDATSNEYTTYWNKYIRSFTYSKRDNALEQMHKTDNTEYSVYMVDNFVENCLGRGYHFNGAQFNEIVSSMIVPMYILNQLEVSKNKYANYPDLFKFVNINNPPFLPVNSAGTVMNLNEYVEGTILPSHPNYNIMKDISYFIESNRDLDYSRLESLIVKYTTNNLLNLTQQYDYPNKDKYEIPYKIQDMVSYVYVNEMTALVDPDTNKSKYNEMFGSDEKIIEYMMDIVWGMKQGLDDIAKTKPVDSKKYNDIIPTANAIILYPIYMFRWMEQQIQLNKSQCTEDKLKTLSNQNQCYQTIPTSQMARKRASYVEPSVKLSSTM